MSRRYHAKAEWKSTPKATVTPSLVDLAWAAGFMEGEGSFNYTGTAERAQAAQVNLEPLERLQRLFGGQIVVRSNRRPHYICKPIGAWTVNSARARGLMLTLYPLMSKRRQQQIIAAFRHKPSKPAVPTSPMCRHGHVFDNSNTYLWKGTRHCRTCRRLEARTRRIRQSQKTRTSS